MSKTIFFSVLSILIITLSAIDARAEEKPSVIEGERIYMHYCASCHGDKGDGRGFNAKNLDPRPAAHTDREFMSKRSDKDLYDAVTGGGRAIGKATLMPPWGGVLSDAGAGSVVMYLRKLCGCTGP